MMLSPTRTALIALCLVLVPLHVFAQVSVEQDIVNVGNGLMPSFGGGSAGAGLLNGFLAFLSERILMIAAAIATLNIVKAGINLINSQADDKLAKARREIGASVVGIIMGYLADRFVFASYGTPNTPGTALFNPGTSVMILETEAAGIISWVLELVVIVSIIMIVYTAIKVVGSFGKEDGPAEIRKSVFGVVIGLVLLTSASAIQLSFGLNPSGVEFPTGPITAGPLITRAIRIIQVVLGFMAVVGVGVVIFAGFRMIVGLGEEEAYTKSKALIGRVMLGLFVILMSYVFTVFIIKVLNGQA